MHSHKHTLRTSKNLVMTEKNKGKLMKNHVFYATFKIAR